MNVHLPFSFKQQMLRGQDQAKKEDNRKLKHLAEADDLTGLGAHYGDSLGQIYDQGAGSDPAGK
jgi:hypothetical protein